MIGPFGRGGEQQRTSSQPSPWGHLVIGCGDVFSSTRSDVGVSVSDRVSSSWLILVEDEEEGRTEFLPLSEWMTAVFGRSIRVLSDSIDPALSLGFDAAPPFLTSTSSTISLCVFHLHHLKLSFFTQCSFASLSYLHQAVRLSRPLNSFLSFLFLFCRFNFHIKFQQHPYLCQSSFFHQYQTYRHHSAKRPKKMPSHIQVFRGLGLQLSQGSGTGILATAE